MAEFIFKITENSSFSVLLDEKITTECSTIFTYKINADQGDSIRIIVGQNYSNFGNLKYIINNVETSWDGSEQIISFSSDLYISYSISNSGTPGFFNKVDLIVNNQTTSQVYEEVTTRENDSEICGTSLGAKNYDELEDTPDSKIGNANKLVAVSPDESSLIYLDPSSISGDSNYVHNQLTASSSWSINHSLGKYPSVTIIDSNGDSVEGDVVYTDNNNINITFISALEGVAYLN